MRNALDRMMAAAMAGVMVLAGATSPASGNEVLSGKERKDIIFIIMDDVGIDQLKLFGYGGDNPPRTPNLVKIADRGVRFTNVWAMPECSPSRATFFSGRYPIRTGVEAAIVDNHIPQTYLSSFEQTLPRLLSDAGYRTAMSGKYHLGNENDPAGDCAPATRGFDAFRGNMTAGPPSIDPTAGGVDPSGGQACGFFQTTQAGACYFQQGQTITCRAINSGNASDKSTPAESCIQRGGIFTPGQYCGANPPQRSAFDVFNAYYAWPHTTLESARSPYAAPACDRAQTVRRYMSSRQADDAASWWNAQSARRMVTLSFNAIHTPLQPAPDQLARRPIARTYDCGAVPAERALIDSIFEAMDSEIGQFLQQIGVATLQPDGRTIERLHLQGKAIVVVGDNGSFGPTVRTKAGFDASRAKGYVYQTGVWVPLIVAGDFVAQPGRTVDELVNTVDLFNLFGALAGVDVDEAVPSTTTLDAKPLLPYLTRPKQPAIRGTNYTEIGVGTYFSDPSQRSWPCKVASTCSDTEFPTQGFCEDNGGTWYGPGGQQQISSCCAIIDPSAGERIVPVYQAAVRDKRFKLVEIQNTNCAAPLQAGQAKPFPWAEYQTQTSYELYDIRKTKANPTGLDNPSGNKIAACGTNPKACLPGWLKPVFAQLDGELKRIQLSAKPQNDCAAKGDGNMDLVVDAQDIKGWEAFRGTGPSRYDINVDGLTNAADRAIIASNLGLQCSRAS